MTAEEIEIKVEVETEKAIKEFEKLVPALKKQTKQIQEAIQEMFSGIDTSKLTQAVDKAVSLVHKKLSSVDDTNLDIKVNNEKADKAIDETKKKLESLEEQETARNRRTHCSFL